MEYYAHTSEGGGKQLLETHLTNTATLSQMFSINKLKNCAALCGLLHDVGKYQNSFQQKLNGKKISVEHSVCGAKEAQALINSKVISALFCYVIAGHHSGLPDYGSEQSDSDNADLCARLKRRVEDYSAYKSQIKVDVNGAIKEILAFFNSNENVPCNYEFLIRYLFSCLVDADFLDTEEFCVGKRADLSFDEWDKCLEAVEKKCKSFVAQTPLQKSREVLKQQALEHGKQYAPIYLLDMPTGSGKTICSLQLACQRLLAGGKKRIIYIVPYTSIIEQTAKVFEEILNKQAFPHFTILQHHSNFDFDEGDADDDGTGRNTLKMAAENWDVPFIITTNVQFFESIYSNRSSRLRKFHNMADSILVFDEVHTLPMKYFSPCMKAVEQLTKNYNSEAIFLSATMPDFANIVQRYIGHTIPMVDLLPNKDDYQYFVKCRYHFIGEQDILAHYGKDRSALMIFNKKRVTEEFYNRYDGGKKYYLSTYMTPMHRFAVLDQIREDLKKNEKIAVFSTSLIEAGVDVDFDCVYREITGLDSILQAAGRCNREGKRGIDESNVYIFTYPQSALKGEIAVKAEITNGLIAKYGAEKISTQACLKEYFDEIYRYTQGDKVPPKEDPYTFYRIDFKQKAQDFQFIDSSTVLICVPESAIEGELEKLKSSGFANRRLLQKYSASVSYYEWKELMEQGIIADYNGVYVLQNSDYYSRETGLCVRKEMDYIY
jgi:CRISPR-associated endonuclease/helicase Cas3